jgi:hypothetical protein
MAKEDWRVYILVDVEDDSQRPRHEIICISLVFSVVLLEWLLCVLHSSRRLGFGMLLN